LKVRVGEGFSRPCVAWMPHSSPHGRYTGKYECRVRQDAGSDRVHGESGKALPNSGRYDLKTVLLYNPAKKKAPS
jgi:hypothetical protein